MEMLTMLIVDDELPAIEAIRQRVNWERLKVGRVLVADSAPAARELFMQEKIHLMLCDIEMPGETGLELLAWVNRCSRETVSIFLTCHADFTYAKEAVHMGAFDYLLKPALMSDIEDVVARAVGEYEKRLSQMEAARQWEENKSSLEQQFWMEFLRGRFNLPGEVLRTELVRRGIDIDTQTTYLPLICSARRWTAAPNSKDFETLEYAWRNLLTEIFTFHDCPPAVLSQSLGRKVILVPGAGTVTLDDIGSRCRQFIDVLQQFFVGSAEFFCGSVCFYVGRCGAMDQLPEIYGQIVRLEQENVAYDGQVFYLDNIQGAQGDDMKPVLDEWRSMMESGRLEELCGQVCAYLDGAVRSKRMSRDFLQQFYHNFSQMVYAVLATRDILAQQLLGDIVPSPEEAQHSVEQMSEYAVNVLRAAMSYMNTVGHGSQVVETVKAYISEHIYEDISRDDLARHVYLNPNYLSRVFSNETGTSLIDYITSAKLSRVRQLLKDPELSITEAAGQVGYTNMPYFSRLYKKKFGMSPAEDRKRM